MSARSRAIAQAVAVGGAHGHLVGGVVAALIGLMRDMHFLMGYGVVSVALSLYILRETRRGATNPASGL